MTRESSARSAGTRGLVEGAGRGRARVCGGARCGGARAWAAARGAGAGARGCVEARGAGACWGAGRGRAGVQNFR
jgi:hypothetical protein